ncbi:MAG: Multidrug resistance transporter, Bcr/CflA family, partial [uncultured Craurococcus sp.]
ADCHALSRPRPRRHVGLRAAVHGHVPAGLPSHRRRAWDGCRAGADDAGDLLCRDVAGTARLRAADGPLRAAAAAARRARHLRPRLHRLRDDGGCRLAGALALRPGARRLRRDGDGARHPARHLRGDGDDPADVAADAGGHAGADPGALDRRAAARPRRVAGDLLGADGLWPRPRPGGGAGLAGDAAARAAAAGGAGRHRHGLCADAGQPALHGAGALRRAADGRDVRLHHRLALRLHGTAWRRAGAVRAAVRRECARHHGGLAAQCDALAAVPAGAGAALGAHRDERGRARHGGDVRDRQLLGHRHPALRLRRQHRHGDADRRRAGHGLPGTGGGQRLRPDRHAAVRRRGADRGAGRRLPQRDGGADGDGDGPGRTCRAGEPAGLGAL